jgi:hypothetical protein
MMNLGNLRIYASTNHAYLTNVPKLARPSRLGYSCIRNPLAPTALSPVAAFVLLLAQHNQERMPGHVLRVEHQLNFKIYIYIYIYNY